LPGAEIVYDRFDVQRLPSDAADRVRRAMVRDVLAADDGEAARAIKNSRYALLKNPWNLNPAEHEKLSSIGFTEGINNKLRLVAGRALGFHSPEPQIAMLFLTCGGIRPNPPLPTKGLGEAEII
jgi:transposase